MSTSPPQTRATPTQAGLALLPPPFLWLCHPHKHGASKPRSLRNPTLPDGLPHCCYGVAARRFIPGEDRRGDIPSLLAGQHPLSRLWIIAPSGAQIAFDTLSVLHSQQHVWPFSCGHLSTSGAPGGRATDKAHSPRAEVGPFPSSFYMDLVGGASWETHHFRRFVCDLRYPYASALAYV
jgi:hypothetical protein